MVKIVGIQFKGIGRIYYFDPLDIELTTEDFVVVETVRGIELGHVAIANREVEDEQVEYELKPIIRKATDKDIEQENKNNEHAEKNFEIFKSHVTELNLDMKPLYCEYTLDQSKIIFYYSANDRVDFRELLKILAPEFRTRVELRQIGSREAARIIGGIGTCGRVLCCTSYLKDFDFVTMKMAKEQSMSLNTSKISGACDKLMCCIAYESELYKQLRQEVPGIGTYVKTPSCEFCKVVNVDYVKRIVKTQENPTGMPVAHDASKVEVIDMKKHRETTEVVTSGVVSNNNNKNDTSTNKEVVESTNNKQKATNEKENKKSNEPKKKDKTVKQQPNQPKEEPEELELPLEEEIIVKTDDGIQEIIIETVTNVQEENRTTSNVNLKKKHYYKKKKRK